MWGMVASEMVVVKWRVERLQGTRGSAATRRQVMRATAKAAAAARGSDGGGDGGGRGQRQRTAAGTATMDDVDSDGGMAT